MHVLRRAAAVIVVACIGSLATVVVAPPANAVPVDGVYSGTVTRGGTSVPITVELSTKAPGRAAVTALIDVAPGAKILCWGEHDLAGSYFLTSTAGGIPSAFAQTSSTIVFTGPAVVDIWLVPFTAVGTVSADRSTFSGTVTMTLPAGCGTVAFTFSARSDIPYTIRTGHDGTSVGGIDLTHMIDREPPGTETPWERCIFLFATPPPGTAAPTSAAWRITPGTTIGLSVPAGVHLKSGWSGGDPGAPGSAPNPLRTQVCITNLTPPDTTFMVTIDPAPISGAVAGRVLLWVGTDVNYAGRAQGDVHYTTFDETHYDFQGVGEYVDAVAGDGKDFNVQSRSEPVPGAGVTVTTAIAARVNGDRIGLYLDGAGVPQWYLDGSPLSVPAKLPSGGEITNPSPEHWRVTWPDTGSARGGTTGTTMQASFARWAPRDHLNIDELVLGPGLGGGQVQGLLGVADGDPANDLTPSTGGSALSPDTDPALPPYAQPLYRDFARSWLVTSGGRWESAFDHLDPGHPDAASYDDEKFPAEWPGVVDDQARTVCTKAGVTAWPQFDFCTYDVAVTGAREIAGYYRDGWIPDE
jgi:hypothetical protein